LEAGLRILARGKVEIMKGVQFVFVMEIANLQVLTNRLQSLDPPPHLSSIV
jgi:hypothetical protein